MDVSPASSSRCSSDFSIERILSDDSRSQGDRSETPSWLCCTRYQPPRIPRATNSACRIRRSGRHARVPFTAAQAAALEAAYARAPYLAPPALRALAAALQLRDDRIKIWFQNRRARERREKSAVITPPLAVTLPATTSHVFMTSNPWTRSNNTYASRKVVCNSVNPRDLSATSQSSNHGSCSGESDEDKMERADTPLDVES